MKNYKVDKQVQEQIGIAKRKDARPGYGLIMHFNVLDNTATVAMSRPGSDQMGEIFSNVPCPVQLGVQTVAPEVGRPCWLEFKDGTQSNPIVTTYFSHSYDELDYDRQYYIDNDTPRFMTEL